MMLVGRQWCAVILRMTAAYRRNGADSQRNHSRITIDALSLSDDSVTFPQETTADELEEAYRGEVWNPARGHTEEQKQGITAARVELRTMSQECKVILSR